MHRLLLLLLVAWVSACAFTDETKHVRPDGSIRFVEFDQFVNLAGHNQGATREVLCYPGKGEVSDANPEGMLCTESDGTHGQSSGILPHLTGDAVDLVVGVRQARAIENAAGNIRPDETNINQNDGSVTQNGGGATLNGGTTNVRTGAVSATGGDGGNSSATGGDARATGGNATALSASQSRASATGGGRRHGHPPKRPRGGGGGDQVIIQKAN